MQVSILVVFNVFTEVQKVKNMNNIDTFLKILYCKCRAKISNKLLFISLKTSQRSMEKEQCM